MQTYNVLLSDGQARMRFPLEEDAATLTYYISINYGIGLLRYFPFCKNGKAPLTLDAEQDLVINEFVASNKTGKMDAAGEYDDWIEIYNKGGQTINLAQYYLSDDPLQPSKWRLPEKLLYPAQYLAIWMDGDTEQGETHANIKLAKSGEHLGLSTVQRGGVFPVDTFSYGRQETDYSSARLPNGTGDFVQTDMITFGSNNERPSSATTLEHSIPHVYPNPASEYLYIAPAHLSDCKKEVYSIAGRRLTSVNEYDDKVLVAFLSPGIYKIKLITKDKVIWETFVKE